MSDDYILVKKSFRQREPKHPDYMSMKKFMDVMLDEHGLEYDVIGYYGKSDYTVNDNFFSPYKVKDKGKALKFVFTHSDFVENPNFFKNNT